MQKIKQVALELEQEFKDRNYKLNIGKWTDVESQQFIDGKYPIFIIVY